MPAAGVRGVELGELIAEGSFGAVYRATQPSVGREVAVKVVRAELADDPDFIRRFESEAQIVARLEHPHIVPLHDYWREPGGAFLVMRYVRGGTVEEALQRGDADLGLVTRVVEQIGGALAVAHEVGVLHRDVKPSNILLDERGDTYLTDFGIAVDVEAGGGVGGSVGSPLYVAPEQVAGGAVDGRSDLYSLAVVVFELLTGQPPLVADSVDELLRSKPSATPATLSTLRPDLPSAMSDVLTQALGPAPDQRQDSIVGFANAFLSAAAPATPGSNPAATASAPVGARSTVVRAEVEIPNPYRGLQAFSEADAGAFYGRTEVAGRLVEAVAEHRFVTVVGASGSGKSSVVRAGVIPALRTGAVPGSQNWFITTVTPSTRPFEQLEAGLLKVAVNPPDSLLTQLVDGARGLSRALLRVLPDDGQLLLVLDQFEELFTLTDPADRDQFLDAISTAVQDPNSQLRIVVTVRADFYDGPLSHPAIGELVRIGSMPVPPMNQVELTDAITLPARVAGVSFEPALITRLITDVHGAPGSLPLLQYALTELFESRDGTTITEEAYDQVGGITGALATRAEHLYQSLDADARAATRRVFGRLVNLGEGTEDTRRRVDQSELATDEPTQAVLDTYGRARLLSFDRNPQTRTPTVEVAHEALIREWPRFRDWLNDDRDTLRVLAHLSGAALAWDQRGRDTSDLYRGARLDAAAQLRATNTRLTELETDYVAASTQEDQRERTRQHRTNRRLRLLLVAAASLLVLAAAAGVLAQSNARRADRNAVEAEASATAARNNASLAEDRAFASEVDRLVARSGSLPGRDRSLGILLAVEAWRLRSDSSSERALLNAVAGSPSPRVVLELGSFDAVSLAGGSGHFAVVAGGVLTIRDRHGVRLATVDGGWTDPLLDLSADGAQWAIADVATGEVVHGTIDGRSELLAPSHGSDISSISISSEGRYVAVGSKRVGAQSAASLEQAAPAIWDLDLATFEPLGAPDGNASSIVDVVESGASVSGENRIWHLTQLDPSGFRATLAPPIVWDLFYADGSPVDAPLSELDANALILFDSGRGYVRGTSTGLVSAVRITEMEEYFGQAIYLADGDTRPNYELVLPLGEPIDLSAAGGVTALTALEGQGVIAVGTDRGYLAVVNVMTGTIEVAPIRVATSAISAIAMTGDEPGFAVVAGTELTFWDRDFRGLAATLLTELGPGVTTTAGSSLVHGSRDGLISILDSEGAIEAVLDRGSVIAASLSPDGSRLLALTDDARCTTFPFQRCRSELEIFSMPERALVASMTVPTDGRTAPIDFSPTGQHVALGAANGQLIVVDITDGATLRSSGEVDSARRTSSVSFLSDTRLITTHDDGNLVIWDFRTDELAAVESHVDANASSTAVLPNGRLILGTRAGAIHEVEPTSPTIPLRTLLAHAQPVTRLDLSVDGTRLVSSTSATVIVWDLAVGIDLLTIENASDGLMTNDGTRLITSSPRSLRDHAVPALWNLDPNDLTTHACSLVTRRLTDREREEYLPNNAPTRPTCIGIGG